MNKIIEFLGMPATGKSTQINLLNKKLIESGKTVTNYTVDEVNFNLEHGLYEFNKKAYQLLVKRYTDWVKNPTDYLILDRGFYDKLVWPETDCKAGFITLCERDSLNELFKKGIPKIDYLFLMIAPPETCLKRRPKPIKAIDFISMNQGFLTALYNNYQIIMKELPNHYLIDYSKKIEEINEEILGLIIANP